MPQPQRNLMEWFFSIFCRDYDAEFALTLRCGASLSAGSLCRLITSVA
jgi:hypothetical protein